MDAMKQYFGTREFGRGEAFVRSGNGDDVRPLAPRNDLVNHSPTGFEWGDHPTGGARGSGPAQLAIAILADALGDEPALALYQDFKWQFVAAWRDAWSIGEQDVRAWQRQQACGAIRNQF